MDRLRVGVVFGGRSVEHDVSIVTAHQAMAALESRHEVVPVYIDRDGLWWTSAALNDIEVFRDRRWTEVGQSCRMSPVPGEGLLTSGAAKKARLLGKGGAADEPISLDVVLPAIHGTFGEDGTLQGLLDLAGIPYAGSGVAASAVGMDKVVMKSAFKASGLPVVPDVFVESERLDRDPDGVVTEVERELGFPCFVKPVRAGSSVGIGKATDRDSLLEKLDVARRYDRRLLVERSMEGCLEINCSVLGGIGAEARVSVCEQPVAWQEFLSFEDKYLRGGKQSSGTKSSEGMASLDRKIPAPISDQLTKQVQENALAAFRALDAAGVARVDSFVKEDTGETWVMEINTTPGSFAFYLWEATGVTFSDLMDEVLQIAVSAHRARQELLFTFDSTILAQQRGGKTSG
jgi:D-alanine-D-alanine ligase